MHPVYYSPFDTVKVDAKHVIAMNQLARKIQTVC